jgi:hypothetical protein
MDPSGKLIRTLPDSKFRRQCVELVNSTLFRAHTLIAGVTDPSALVWMVSSSPQTLHLEAKNRDCCSAGIPKAMARGLTSCHTCFNQ